MRVAFANALIAAAMAAAILCAAPAAAHVEKSSWVAVATPGGTPLSAQPVGRRLLAKAEADGTVSVIVGLDLPLRDEDQVSPTEARAQASALAGAQEALVVRIGGRGTKKFSVVPSIALEVTHAELGRLLADPMVTHVYEDVSLQPTLGDSTRIIGARRLWEEREITGANQVVAILDTGVSKAHRMLQDKVTYEACFSTKRSGANATRSFCPGGAPESFAFDAGVNCPAKITLCHHGTHVASIAAGSSAALKGVAPDAEIWAIQVASKHLKTSCSPVPCAAFVLSDVIKGLELVYKKRAPKLAAVTLSVSGEQFDGPCDSRSPETTTIITKLRTAGIPVIIGAGNNGQRGIITFPACISRAIAVGATDKDDALWGSSNHSGLVKLLAPGVNIKAAVPPGSTKCPVVTGNYCVLTGTSQAAPHLAGAFALLRSADITPKPSLPAMLTALNCTGRMVTGNVAFPPRRRINVYNAYDELRDVEGDENYGFNVAGSGSQWRRDLEEWSLADGNFRTSTSTWASDNIWAMASAPYCGFDFTAKARMRQIDPTEPPQSRRYPLETGLLIATHITEVFGIPQSDGYHFTLSRPDDGSEGSIATVKRLDNRSFAHFQIGTEVVKPGCKKHLPAVDRKNFHTLSAEVFGPVYSFAVDGNAICEFTEFRYAPPSRVGLTARREGPAGGPYTLLVDSVRIKAGP